MSSLALADTVRADVPVLAAIARRLCGNAFDADDLVQDTIERALRAGDRYAEQGNRRGWLATILRNRFRDRCRAARELPSDELEQIAMPETVQPAAWEHLTATHVGEAVTLLEPCFRGVYELHASGQSYAEIARALGISINTVGTRLLRARAKLKVILNATASVC